jgi:predicted component of type VI protein secretion system
VEARLVVVRGDSQTRQFDLHLPTIIGRSRSTDVRLGHPLVSRQHCEVFESNGMLMVRDLGSLNGTFVGEMRIAEQAMPVKPGDLLTIGPVTFQAVYGSTGDRRTGGDLWSANGPTIDGPLSGIADGDSRPNPPPDHPPHKPDNGTAPPKKGE